MNRKFERALLLCPSTYPIFNSLITILKELSCEAKGFDVRESINKTDLGIHAQMFRLPYKVRLRWENYFLRKTNQIILKRILSYNPDLVLIYNSEYLLSETCVGIKKQAKLVFFMGDSPFFTHANPYYLHCLTYADLILSPDTFWINQLNTLGIHRTSFFIPGIDTSSYHLIDDQKSLNNIECMDLLYTGASYVNSWGYQKALLMSQFIGLNFKLYGNRTWKRWFRFFPELESYYTESGYIPTEQLNKMYNKTKLMPVDGNPAILNGFHLRLFEALGAGVLPLVEYRKDVEELLFKDSDLMVPLIRDYNKANDLARYYLKNESERKELAKALREFILSHYDARKNSERLIMLLKENSVL